jgi:hypothetical protein
MYIFRKLFASKKLGILINHLTKKPMTSLKKHGPKMVVAAGALAAAFEDASAEAIKIVDAFRREKKF